MNDTFHTNTQILGVIGHPIKHTYSPLIHNTAAELLGLDLIYLPFDVPQSNLKDALKGVVALGLKGLNVTVPHKESILVYLQEVSEEASIVGSVNTVVNDMGKLVGFNTDVYGIVETVKEYREEINGNDVTIIGAGGAARAAIFAMIRHFKPAKINIVNRTEQKAETLREYYLDKMKYEEIYTYELFPPDLLDIFRKSKLIINATQVGMNPEVDDTVINLKNAFVEGQIVFDMVYNPTKTKLLELAESQKAVPLNGIKMLVAQGAKSFEHWTGSEMPVDKVSAALTKYLDSHA